MVIIGSSILIYTQIHKLILLWNANTLLIMIFFMGFPMWAKQVEGLHIIWISLHGKRNENGVCSVACSWDFRRRYISSTKKVTSAATSINNNFEFTFWCKNLEMVFVEFELCRFWYLVTGTQSLMTFTWSFSPLL